MAVPDPLETLRRSLANGQTTPVNVLHGPEGYFIDLLIKDFEKLIPAEDREFGLTTLYAPQVEAAAIVDACRQIPMMTDRQVVIVKEAQNVNAAYIDSLARYAESPTPSTVLVVCSRGENIKGKEFIKIVKSHGTVFEAKKVTEWQIPAIISKYIKSKGLSADTKALEMLRDFIGTDLSRLYNEIDKLAEILGPTAMITPEAIERNIGVSKEFNNFELVDAIAAHNTAKAFTIARYFESNPKANPLVVTASTLFNYFSDLLIAQYAVDRSDRGIQQELGLKSEYAVRKFRAGMSSYSPRKVTEILDAIRRFDAMSKGSGSRQDAFRLFHDLLFKILS